MDNRQILKQSIVWLFLLPQIVGGALIFGADIQQAYNLLLVLYHQVTSYTHGSSELLGIQIDAAINPGKCILKNYKSNLNLQNFDNICLCLGKDFMEIASFS